MPIRKRELEALSAAVRRIIDGQPEDPRDDREGALSILKNDIYTLASQKNEQVAALRRDRDLLRDTLADISHQLKTPLTSMLLMTDLLDGETDPDKRAEFLQNLRSGLERMDWLVSALLKLAKLDAGAVRFVWSHTPSAELLDLALEPLRLPLERKGQRVELSGEADCYCDRRWTAEALTNILKNASEHSPAGGVIRVRAGSNPLCAWISVTDSGPGLAAGDLPRLFRRFEGSRSDVGYGVGLPLALSILRGQNGDIEAENAETGAVFTVKLYR